MKISNLWCNNNILLFIVVCFFAGVGFLLRLLPMEQLTTGPFINFVFQDSWYNIRLIEVITSNFPNYPWFDAMTSFPVGKENDWGPVYPMFSAAIALLVGVKTRVELMTVVSWIPPILSLIMVPIIYKLGTIVENRKTGIIAACLISIIPGEYIYRSFFGYIDHHFMEVLFSTALFLFYLLSIKEIEVEKSKIFSPLLCIYSISAGIFYFLGIMTIPTIVLFAGIISIFCLLHFIIARDEKSMKSITIVHTILFGIFIALFALFGIHVDGFSISRYSSVHILFALALIIEPIILTLFIRLTHNQSSKHFWGLFFGASAMSIGIVSFLFPRFFNFLTIEILNYLFFTSEASTINEMQMWDLYHAFYTFDIALPLMGIGIILMVYQLFKQYDPKKIFLLIWAITVIGLTILHVRYQYYIAVIIVLLTSIVLTLFWDFFSFQSIPTIRVLECIQERWHCYINKYSGLKKGPLFLICLIMLIIMVHSIQNTQVVVEEQLPRIDMSNDWYDGLMWLNINSPDPGVDYLKIYNQENFSYPNTSYGVLSWWDYGHYVTVIGKRIPITSPFQDNAHQVAQFFLATEEKNADKLAEELGAKYVIIDSDTIGSKFANLPLWAYGKNESDKYQEYYYQSSGKQSGVYDKVLTLKSDFFNSLASRLYLFDGTEVNGSGGYLVQYQDKDIDGQQMSIISNITPISSTDAEKVIFKPVSSGIDLVSVQYTRPINNVHALAHYRLLYESPTISKPDSDTEFHDVKIFEHVSGYQINGTGTVELPLITNQGRSFIYRQESINGSFVLPYSTIRDGKKVHATGPYKLLSTGDTFEVTEEMVDGTKK
jgi:dolichyl-diphosphooligosaccharide---protein glycosyltransferase